MDTTVTVDLRHVAREVGLPIRQVQVVVELLDDGNTVPFVTRYRKDHTGGLDEEQIRRIQDSLTRQRLLGERKQTILRSIESQGKLTEKLAKQIRSAGTTKRLEDLYLPYKPKKQTLATVAHSRGLEPLAREILEADPACADLDARAADFVSTDRQVPTAADALLGAGHILAEWFSERAELRQRLRQALQKSGILVSSRVGAEEKKGKEEKPGKVGVAPAAPPVKGPAPAVPTTPQPHADEAAAGDAPTATPDSTSPARAEPAAAEAAVQEPPVVTDASEGTAAPAEDPDKMPQDATTPAEISSAEGEAAEPVSSVGAEPEDGPASVEREETEATPPAPSQSEIARAGEESLDGGQPAPDDRQPPTEPPAGVAAQEGATGERGPRGATEEAEEPNAPGSPTSSGEADNSGPHPSDPPSDVAPTDTDTHSEAAGSPTLEASPEAPQPPEAEASPDAPEQPHQQVEAPADSQSGPTEAADSGPLDGGAAPAKAPPAAPVEAVSTPADPGAATVTPPDSPTQKAPQPESTGKPKPAVAKPRAGKSKRKKPKKSDEKKTKSFRDYFDFREEIRKIPPHRVLAINRGERAKVLRVKVECNADEMQRETEQTLVPEEHPHREFLLGCARDALTRLILPSLEREARRELTEKAEAHAVTVFARNLRSLLLQSPVHDRRVLAIDPGLRSGCKLAALDQFGNPLDQATVLLVGKPEKRDEAKAKVVELIERYQLSLVAIGNGTGCRETEDFVSELIAGPLEGKDVAYVIVNEAGASVYSTSRTGREEFPQHDAAQRGSISIGRRLQDPLSELVKIDPANIGVGLYQHDVKAKHLQTSLDEVVESCVNYVGVNANTASPALLRYVSGLNQLTARRMHEYRLQHGPYRNREQFREVPGFGEATFVQAAGFLKIGGGDNPLDSSWIHPESYGVAEQVLAKLGYTVGDLSDKAKTAELSDRAKQVDAAEMARELDVGTHLLRDILAQLRRPGRDPRDDLPGPIFKKGVLKLEDLSPGMELHGTVLNVVDFGAFVDIGMHDSGLVHISQLANRFVRDPHAVVSVGDIVKVWVVEVDKTRRRVSLTMIPPGTQRTGRRERGDDQPTQTRPKRTEKPSGARPPRRERSAEAKGKPPEGKPPQGKGPRRGKPRHGPPPRRSRGPYEVKAPKPPAEITEEMKQGKEPMRTFGELLKFYEDKEEGEDDAQDRGTDQNPPTTPDGSGEST